MQLLFGCVSFVSLVLVRSIIGFPAVPGEWQGGDTNRGSIYYDALEDPALASGSPVGVRKHTSPHREPSIRTLDSSVSRDKPTTPVPIVGQITDSTTDQFANARVTVGVSHRQWLGTNPADKDLDHSLTDHTDSDDNDTADWWWDNNAFVQEGTPGDWIRVEYPSTVN
ncbi:hypothetical protein BJ085DRAFT_31111 [Dimargaris cristalligena]|uniref:Uncharacterized protein n=1 Tax=Dimargaris cristalligena TaxID=215637 RepID=A0A4P9ZXB8_9FUNG|nr:hypothetical protein BJ085DRAFT_31111 [Dimargaris cristalligena]|eukprot:RKP38316.1 hypothetical protein BJ085DRAFT_31111 [Dimargaris cristalligena]